jgi:hypothetical protein
MSTNVIRREVQPWVMGLTALGAVLVLAFVCWRALTGGTEAVGPSKVVHAGQYNIMADIQKMRAAREAQR